MMTREMVVGPPSGNREGSGEAFRELTVRRPGRYVVMLTLVPDQKPISIEATDECGVF
jgi:hypothetical protein